MRPLSKPAAVFLLLAIFGTASPRAEEAVRSKNGLLPDEIISSEDLKAKLDAHEDFLLLDARPRKTYDGGHIVGAELPRSEEYYRQEDLFTSGLAPSPADPDAGLAEGMKSIPRDRPVVTYCNSNCHASAMLALSLKKQGFTNVRSMEEGYQEWEKKDYPVVKPPLVASA